MQMFPLPNSEYVHQLWDHLGRRPLVDVFQVCVQIAEQVNVRQRSVKRLTEKEIVASWIMIVDYNKLFEDIKLAKDNVIGSLIFPESHPFLEFIADQYAILLAAYKASPGSSNPSPAASHFELHLLTKLLTEPLASINDLKRLSLNSICKICSQNIPPTATPVNLSALNNIILRNRLQFDGEVRRRLIPSNAAARKDATNFPSSPAISSVSDDWQSNTNGISKRKLLVDEDVPESWEDTIEGDASGTDAVLTGTSSNVSSSLMDNNAYTIHDLILRSLRSSFTAAERHQLSVAIKNCTEGLSSALEHSNLRLLVEKNPAIAIDFLIRIASLEAHNFDSWLDTILSGVDVSLQSLEVVNKLASTVPLPPDFLRSYVSNCLNACSSLKDRSMQQRLTRLVCVFVSSLLRQRIIDRATLGQNLLVELQTFALESSRIKEAVQLYKQLVN